MRAPVETDRTVGSFMAAEFGVLLMFGYGLSLWFGVALVDASAMVNLLGAWQHYHLFRH
jgi:hypothetical protein